MINIINNILNYFKDNKDPIKICPTYLIEGCSHVDGFLCNPKKCNPTILVYSHNDFDEICESNGWNDDNIESIDNLAVISIIGTLECRKYWLEDETDHWFKTNHENVLNIEFDDVDEDIVYEGHLFKVISDKDARKIVDFIDDNIGKTFFIHCRAGKSRSQAIFRFMADFYPSIYTNWCGRRENPCKSPNIAVVASLKRAFYEKNGLFVDENKDF